LEIHIEIRRANKHHYEFMYEQNGILQTPTPRGNAARRMPETPQSNSRAELQKIDLTAPSDATAPAKPKQLKLL
jgi:hypothetical protein